MDQITRPNGQKLNNKDFPGAIEIVQYFERTGYNYRRLARLFDKENYSGLIAVMRSDRWTAEDVERWKKVIETHKRVNKKVKSKATSTKTVITKKVKGRKLRTTKRR